MAKLNERLDSCLYQRMPKYVMQALKSNTRLEAETRENIGVLVFKMADIADVIRHVTVNGMVNLLTNFFKGLDQLLLDTDIYRQNKYATETVLIFGLHQKQNKCCETKTIASVTAMALQLNNFARKFSNERLHGINTEVVLQSGLASGSVYVGIMGNLVPCFTVFGNVLEEASSLARNAKPREVRISQPVHSCLKRGSRFKTCEWVENGVSFTCYHNRHTI